MRKPDQALGGEWVSKTLHIDTEGPRSPGQQDTLEAQLRPNRQLGAKPQA